MHEFCYYEIYSRSLKTLKAQLMAFYLLFLGALSRRNRNVWHVKASKTAGLTTDVSYPLPGKRFSYSFRKFLRFISSGF